MENLFLVSIGINTDILETNIINIFLLVGILFKFVGDFLKTQLSTRKSTILNEVEGAEKRLTDAVERLNEAKTQAGQASIIIAQIEEKTNKLRKNIVINNWKRGYEDVCRLENASNLAIKYETQKAIREIQDSLLATGLTNAYSFIIKDLTYEECCQLNTKRIEQLPTFS